TSSRLSRTRASLERALGLVGIRDHHDDLGPAAAGGGRIRALDVDLRRRQTRRDAGEGAGPVVHREHERGLLAATDLGGDQRVPGPRRIAHDQADLASPGRVRRADGDDVDGRLREDVADLRQDARLGLRGHRDLGGLRHGWPPLRARRAPQRGLSQYQETRANTRAMAAQGGRRSGLPRARSSGTIRSVGNTRGVGRPGLGLIALFLLAACARTVPTSPPRPPTVGSEERGLASWYGYPHHGRRTASGEVFDMRDLTAAHRTLPLGTRLMVTNVDNGQVVEVRINDRGPFVEGRILDLSHGAARLLGAVGSGVIPVRLRVVALPGDGATGAGR